MVDGCPMSVRIDDWIAQDPHALDSDLDDIALPQIARRLSRVSHARWRTRQDDRSSKQRHATGEVGDQLRHWKDHRLR